MNLILTPPPRRYRKDIIYRLRRKGVRIDVRHRTIFFPFGDNPNDVVQIRRLRNEFNFNVQLEIRI
jgi:hypothetical protein